MNASKKQNDDALSITVDKALLKLAKDYGIAIPKDDYVLCQIYLNKAILDVTFNDLINSLATENEKNKKFFKDAMIISAKKNHQIELKYKKYTLGILCLSSASFIGMCLSLINSF